MALASCGSGLSKNYTETFNGIDMKFVLVEKTDVLITETSKQGKGNEKTSVRQETMDAYYIGVFEVTQRQWEKVMGPSNKLRYGNLGVGADYPVIVSWEEARAFCQKLSEKTAKTFCLPDGGQWELAFYGGKHDERTKYSGSWSIDAVAWYKDNSGGSTHPVGTKRPNALGIYDMSGNVWEWCQNLYKDENGVFSDSLRSLRGGGYSSIDELCKASSSGGGSPKVSYTDSGFRVVLLP